jgi:uncharacterized membrane-anchored protein
LKNCFKRNPLAEKAAATNDIIPGMERRKQLVVKSNKSFPETLKAFKEEVRQTGGSVLNGNNMAGVLSERGFTGTHSVPPKRRESVPFRPC